MTDAGISRLGGATSSPPPSPPSSRLRRPAGAILALASLGYISLFLVLAILRMRYPFELEWIEGAYVDESRWILAGNLPYGPPSIFYLPTSKTPLFFYLAAGMMKVFGEGFLAPRLLSTLSAAGSFTLLYLLVSQSEVLPTHNPQRRQHVAGLLAAGFYAASYRFTGAWMDLAKTDSLFLFLLLLAFWLGARAQKPWQQVASGALFVLAFLTKQLALVVILAIAPLTLLTSRGRTWLRWLSAAILGLAVFYGLQAMSQDWFSFFTLDTSLQHERVADVWLFWQSLLAKFWPAVLLALAYLAVYLRSAWRSRWLLPENGWNLIGLAGALILTSWGIYLKTWTYDNGFMPACLGLSLLAGLGYAEIERQTPAWGLKALAAGALLALIQLAALYYPPAAQLPTQRDRQATQRFLERLSELPGEVWVFNHGFFNHLAGKTTYLHSATLGDVLGGAVPPAGSELSRRWQEVAQMFGEAISSQRFDWVIVDQLADYWAPYYIQVQELSEEFYPVTGVRTRPRFLLGRNPVALGGRFPLESPTYQGLLSGAWQDTDGQGRWLGEGGGSLKAELSPEQSYRLLIRLSPACEDGQPAVQSLQVSWNSLELESLAFGSCSAQQAVLSLAAGLEEDGRNELRLVPQPYSGVESPARVNIHLIEFILE